MRAQKFLQIKTPKKQNHTKPKYNPKPPIKLYFIKKQYRFPLSQLHFQNTFELNKVGFIAFPLPVAFRAMKGKI